MTEGEEKAYVRGSRDTWLTIFREAAGHLGYDTTEGRVAVLLEERERAVAALRELCAEHGDNDWPDNARLADVIERNLAPYLDEGAEDEEEPAR